MRHLMGLALAGGLLLGMASTSNAQFSLNIGNPYAGQGLSLGTAGYGYGYPGYAGYGLPGYGNVYNGYTSTGYVAGPGTFTYGSGYRGYVAPVAPVVPYSYGYGYRPRPYYSGYGSYYRGYGYNRAYGFQPFRGAGRMFR